MDEATAFQSAFFGRVANLDSLLGLFETLPEIYFFAKDAEGRFTMMNRPLLSVFNLDDESAILGKTDFDFFSADLAERYQAEDQEVMRTGRIIPHRVWIVPNHLGVLRWYVSSKAPLFDHDGKAIGIAGAMRDYEKAGAALAPYQRFSEAMRFVTERYGQKITTDLLARKAHLSVSQFNREFRKLFGITPAQYVAQVRVNAVCRDLTAGSDDLESIARRCGFYDASHMVKQFKKVMGQTPAAYRRQAHPAN